MLGDVIAYINTTFIVPSIDNILEMWLLSCADQKLLGEQGSVCSCGWQVSCLAYAKGILWSKVT